MSLASFVQAHAANADWRVALAQGQRQLQTQIAARAAQHGESAAFTLGWCYLSDCYAPAAEAILEELRLRLPGVAWVGTVGVGVAASGVEYINEPALVLMIARCRAHRSGCSRACSRCRRHRPDSWPIARWSMPKAARPPCRSCCTS
jgi:small ligand-binding sensory domain FIST